MIEHRCTLLREGEPTADGRMIAVRAVTWDDEPFPIVARGGLGVYVEVGEVRHVIRQGPEVIGEVRLDGRFSRSWWFLSAYLSDTVWTPPAGDAPLIVTAGRLDGCTVLNRDSDVPCAPQWGRLRPDLRRQHHAWRAALRVPACPDCGWRNPSPNHAHILGPRP